MQTQCWRRCRQSILRGAEYGLRRPGGVGHDGRHCAGFSLTVVSVPVPLLRLPVSRSPKRRDRRQARFDHHVRFEYRFARFC